MPARPVLFVSPNPALDRVALAPGARAGGTVRASAVVEEAGGKALHAATVAKLLGARARVVVPLGGRGGARIHELLEAEGLEVVALAIAEPTRQTYTVVDDLGGDVVEVIEPSPRLSRAEAAELRSVVAAQCERASLVVCCGSWPAGLDAGFGGGSSQRRARRARRPCSTPRAARSPRA